MKFEVFSEVYTGNDTAYELGGIAVIYSSEKRFDKKRKIKNHENKEEFPGR
jgi:hypothetical protein